MNMKRKQKVKSNEVKSKKRKSLSKKSLRVLKRENGTGAENEQTVAEKIPESHPCTDSKTLLRKIINKNPYLNISL